MIVYILSGIAILVFAVYFGVRFAKKEIFEAKHADAHEFHNPVAGIGFDLAVRLAGFSLLPALILIFANRWNWLVTAVVCIGATEAIGFTVNQIYKRLHRI